MKKSLTYHIVLFIFKLKGIKKSFSQDPVDYKSIRKEDVHQPKGGFFKQKEVTRFNVLKTVITQVKQKETSNKLLIFVHGGAFISGPAKHHWDSLKTIYKNTNYNIWMCDYPKAPEHKITEISKNIDAIYNKALETYKASEIVLLGDSVGGTLLTALTQRLIIKGIALPKQLLLVTPVMDASMSNPTIGKIDKLDPMLSKKGILSAKKLCAEANDLQNPMLSPINGDFNGFPPTVLYAAEHDIMYPDQLLAIAKIKNAKIDLEIITGKEMPHIWPFLPVMKEAKAALNDIINKLSVNN